MTQVLLLVFTAAMPNRLPPPWTLRDTGSAFRVTSANGLAVAYVYYGEHAAVGTGLEILTRDEARDLAEEIASLDGRFSET